MKFYALITIVSIILSNTSAYILDHSVQRNCTEVYSITVPKYVPYEETYRSRNWLGVPKTKSRVNYRLEHSISYQTKSVCCSGYSSYGSTLCIPVCKKGCSLNAECVQPETCRCNDGYYMDHSVNECQPICENDCVNGKCVAPNKCDCMDGYRMLPDLYTCVPICDNCDNLEYCVEPHICRCINGYARALIERLDSAPYIKCRAICDRDCVNADCVEPNLCRCHPGYGDLDHDVFTCEPKCGRGCKNGYCSAPDVCTCLPGYQNSVNNSHICEPICSDPCVHADCIAPETCSCHDGYVPIGSEWSHVCVPYCSGACSHGRCTDPEICSCDAGYRSINNRSDCEPICTEPCVMGNCSAPDVCSCFDGHTPVEGSFFKCEPICNSSCVNGKCTAPNECTCNEGYEKKNSTDDESSCIPICYCDNGECNETSSICVTCTEGYVLESLDNTTRCQPHCEGGCTNGRCVEPQSCECDENYVADNDTLGNPICVLACGGPCVRGVCIAENNSCSCPYGWAGKYCDEPIFCTISVQDNQTLDFLTINGSANYEEPEAIIEEPWTGPSCSARCLQEVNNMTKCVGQNDGEVHNMTCFISIDSSCNTYVVVKSDKYKAETNFTTIVASSTLTLILIVAAIGAILFIRKRRREKSIELLKTIQQVQKHDEDNLIDGISL